MFKEFKEFVLRGNILDVAIGLVLALAFGKIVTSFVADILMPPIGLILGRVDFANLFIALNGEHYDTLAAAKAAGAATINYGLFLTAIVDFLIVAFVIFLLLKQVNRLRPAPAVLTRECPHCYSLIPIKATRCAHCTSDLKVA